MKRNDFEFLLSLLTRNVGWNFSEDDYYVIDKKISNFIREHNYASVEELMAELRLGQKNLPWQVIEALAMSDTHFYRDYVVFRRFEEFVLPSLREANRGSKKLRIWSLGCSTGQEAYSIAMAIKRKLLNVSDWDIDIIGTDLSSASISKAQKGVYSSFEVQMGLNAEMIINNFHLEREQWLVNDDIMKMVEFRRYNILDEMALTDKFDVIFCRNTLRFFTPKIQYQILDKVYKAQTNGGFLYLGKDENVDALTDFYDKVPGFDCLYQAKSIALNKVVLPEEKKIEADFDVMPSFIKPASLYEKRPIASELLKK